MLQDSVSVAAAIATVYYILIISIVIFFLRTDTLY